MEVKVKAPATCGEFLQGIWRNQPCLVSAPIDVYSTTHIKNGTQKQKLGNKAKYLIQYFSNKFGIQQSFLNEIEITIDSAIPVSLGMGSSTADLASLLKALSIYFFVDITDEEIGKILTKVEPTDNSFFKQLNLFNHYTGDILYSFNSSLISDILIAYCPEMRVDTIAFTYQREFFKNENKFYSVLETFYRGIKEKNINLIGQASTKSAILNQTCFPNEYFDLAVYLMESYNSPGLLIGHTGSVIGFLANEKTKDEGIKFGLSGANKKFRFLKSMLIQGGLKVETIFN